MTAKTATYPVAVIAKLLLMTDRRVQQLAAEGILPKATRGQYEIAPVVQAYVKYLRDRAIPGDVGPEGGKVGDPRIRLIMAKAEVAEIEAARQREQLLPAGEVLTGWQAAVGRARGLLLGISTAAAARVVQVAHAHQDDPDAAERAIREYLRDQLDAAMAELQNTTVDEPDEDEGDEPEETGEAAVIAAAAKPERRRAH